MIDPVDLNGVADELDMMERLREDADEAAFLAGEGDRTDVEADAEVLAMAGHGTDEDYFPETPMEEFYGGE